MKRVDLIKAIEGFGCVLVRHGGKHDWYRNPASGTSQPVPRHREIAEGLARHNHPDAEQPRGGESWHRPPREADLLITSALFALFQ